MKNLIAIIALLATFSAGARSLHPLTYVLKAELEDINLDQDSYLNNLTIYGGSVQIEQLKREVTLSFQVAPECPVGMMCAQVLRQHNITLPIVSQFTDRCNNTTYIAQRDLRPVDVAYQEITVTDHTLNRCPTFVALPETGITLKSQYFDRLNGNEVEANSAFTATKLKGRVLPVILPIK